MALFFLCIKIFFVRIIDVSLGTFRTIMSVKGKHKYASMIGFFEVLIWFLIVKEALNTNINSIYIAISYSFGFASGTYIGGFISNKLIEGKYALIIFSYKSDQLIKPLRNNGYSVSIFDTYDENDKKQMLFLGIDKKRFKECASIIDKYDNKAFVVVNEIGMTNNGYFKDKKR